MFPLPIIILETHRRYNASWRAVGNWSRVGTMSGWSSADSFRAWSSAHPGEQFTGAGWFRYTFSGADLEQKGDETKSDTLALAISAACGSLTGWVNGAPLKIPRDPVSPEAPLLLEIPRGAVHMSGPNVVALRFEGKEKGGHSVSCADHNGAGLRGRVLVVGAAPGHSHNGRA